MRVPTSERKTIRGRGQRLLSAVPERRTERWGTNGKHGKA